MPSNDMPSDAFSEIDGLPSLVRGLVRIDWVNLGEGFSGDYDESDPDDLNLLWFDVFRRAAMDAEWEAVDDGSFCTHVPASTPADVLQIALVHFMDTIHDDVAAHGRAKRLCEELSWTTPASLVPRVAPGSGRETAT